MEDFATRLRLLRTKRNMTQQELADVLGLTKSTISMWERRQRNPEKANYEAIADFFNVNMDYLRGTSDIEKTEISKLIDQIAESATQHALSDFLWIAETTEEEEYLNELRRRPEMKALFKIAQKATTEDIERTIKIIEMFLHKADNELEG